jgi:membrane-associated protease RseP (regulator of RpoE activity)
LNPKFFDSIVNQKDLTVIATCIPVFVGVLAVQAVHELAHYLVAKARGMKIGLPVPVPSTQLGSFGSITSLRSFPPTQSALIDFALSGPVSAMLLSLVFLVLGAFLTVRASEGALSHFPVVPVSLLKSSFLTGTILSFIAPKALMLPLSQPIPIHPLFMIGFSGLISSALNLLPIFRLDGGRACSAALGNRIGGLASAGTLLFLLSLTLSGGSGVAFAFGMFVVFFQRRPEIPVRDEVTEVDDFRLGAWIASLTTSILALVPFPGGPWFL